MNLLETILFIILPVLLAGVTFIFILKLKILDFISFPLDLGLHFRGKRIFGRNKTLRGPLVMSFFTTIYGWIVNYLFNNPLNFDVRKIITIFFLIGLSYSLGELPNSFIKRQLDIPPGKTSKNIFIIIDTFDSLFVCGIIYVLLFKLPLTIVLSAILIGGFLHLATDKLMVALKLK